MTTRLRVARRSRNSIALGILLLVAALATGLLLAVVLLSAASAATTPPAPPATKTPPARPAAPSRSTEPMTLHGGQEGTAFRTLTVEGEDRVHVEFDRPSLDVDLDASRAPGLELGNPASVLERTGPDVASSLVALSAMDRSPYLARPWLTRFGSGTLARFRPSVTDVERWKLVVANSDGQPVVTYAGKGRPPAEIAWDGRLTAGAYAVPGATYSYVLEAFDKAGNKRNFIGQGFRIPAYRVMTSNGILLAFAGSELAGTGPDASSGDRDATAPIVMEAASWLNQATQPTQPVKVTAVARRMDQADALATTVAAGLARYTLGEATRIRSASVVEPDAPAEGVIRITPGR